MLLVGSAGWTSHRLPRVLSVLYFVGGVASLFVNLRSDFDLNLMLPTAVVSIWLGILLWKDRSGETQLPDINAIQPE
jgi:hypothetical protein